MAFFNNQLGTDLVGVPEEDRDQAYGSFRASGVDANRTPPRGSYAEIGGYAGSPYAGDENRSVHIEDIDSPAKFDALDNTFAYQD